MKKIFAIIISFVVFVSLAACGGGVTENTDENITPNLSWWQENINTSTPVLQIGNAGFNDTAESDDILNMLEKIEYGAIKNIKPMDAHYDAAHIAGLVNETNGKWINAVFYDDFRYVAFSDDSTDSQALYQLENGDEIRQFFIANNYYMPLQKRADIIGNIARIFESGDVQVINNVSIPPLKNDTVPELLPQDQPDYLNICNVTPYLLADSDTEYSACAEVIYKLGDTEKGYVVQLFLDKEYNLTQSYIVEDNLLTQWADRYVIADTDYSVWMQKLDGPYYNNFGYWLYDGSSGYSEDSMEWNSAIMHCIQNLKLGEKVDINIKEYPRNQVYRILLEEGSGYYNINTLLLEFYGDCNYLVICNCGPEGSHPVTACEKHLQAYKVENPQIVRELFSIKGQYVSPQDYQSLQQFAQKYMENSSSAQLNKTANGKKIDEGSKFEGKIAHVKAQNTDHLHLEDGKEDYKIEFMAMFVKTEAAGHDSYTSYQIDMFVYRKETGWELESIYIN